MPSNPYHAIYTFGQQVARAGGWTESYWHSETSLDVAIADARALGVLLRQCHGDSALYLSFGVRKVNSDRVTYLELVEGSNTPVPIPTDPTTDYPTTALSLYLRAAGGYVAKTWIRGIPDAVVNHGGFYLPPPPFINSINAFTGVLKAPNTPWGLYSLVKGRPKILITGFSPVTGLITALGHGMGPNNTKVRVRISRLIPTIANGLQTLNVETTDTLSIVGWVPMDPTTPVNTRRSYFRPQQFDFFSCNEAKVGIATEHKVGRPPRVLSGRRKTRR